MYILKWKDGVDCEMQFEHQGVMLKHVASLLSIPPDNGGKIEITERVIKADDGITTPLFDHLSHDLCRSLDEEIELRSLTLADWLILEKRIENMRSIIYAMKEDVASRKANPK